MSFSPIFECRKTFAINLSRHLGRKSYSFVYNAAHTNGNKQFGSPSVAMHAMPKCNTAKELVFL